ncbi:MAG TPA: hypothetical protein VLH81_14215 [Desulfobacterales bacterium]|nr:hypothetical protein [Desulfobacterales bacterium]
MALINEKDAKVVAGRPEKLAGTASLVVFTQEHECACGRETRDLAEELAGLSGGRVTVEVKDFVADKARAEALGVDKIPAIAVLGGDGTD